MAVVAILLSAGFAATALLSGPDGVAWAQTSPPTGCVTGGPVKAIATGGGDLTQFDIDEGQTLYYELQLRNNPNGSVMVASGLLEPDNPNADERNKLDNADVTVSPSVLFFNSSNWNQSQWVAVSAREDDGAVDGKAIVGHEAVGSPNDVTCVVVNEKDNDTPADPTPTPTPTPTATPEPASVGFVIAKPDGSPLTIKDINDNDFLGLYVANSGSASFVVSLATEPASDVPVNVTKHYDRFGTVNFSPARLDFTTSNWSTPQTITVSSTGPVPGRNGSAVLRLRADRDTEDEAYRQLVWADVRVREFDPPALLLSANPLNVNEGSSASYGVRLHTKPTANVTVTLTEGTGSSDDTDVTVTSSKTLTFTSANYKSTQTVTLAAAHDDDLVNGFRAIAHTAASTDAKYDGLTATLTAHENESDTAAIVVSANAVTVPEGGSATYTVKLSNQPSGDVSVRIQAATPSDPDLAVDTALLSFTTGNWNTAQTVTVSAGQDGDDLPGTTNITHTATGANFAAARQVFVTATEGDDDQRGFIVTPAPGPVTIAEGSSFSYTIKLGTQPTADVTVDFTVYDPKDISFEPVNPPPTFTANNWSTEQTVTFRADEDNNDYVDDRVTIQHTVTTTDSIYAEQTIGDIAVTVTDNDAAIVLSANAVTVPENSSATYTVKLSHAPTADVTVTIAEGTGNDDDTSLRVTGPSSKRLTFTTANWNTAQTVRIYAAGDSDAVNGTRAINHTAAGGGFDSAPTFSVTAIERDSRAAIILRNAADTGNVSSINNVPENGSGVDYKVKLAAQPAGDVTVALSVTGDDDVSVQPASLTFTAGNYATLQTVTVNAATDADLLNGTATIAHAATGGGYDGLAAKNLSATETDTTGQIKVKDAGDSADITGISVPEGGSADYKVQLSHQPTGSVTVRLALQSTSDDGDGDITANKTVLYFNTGNWNTAQEVRLSAREDNDSLRGSRIITHTATGGGYNSPTKTLTATEQDNEVGLTFTDTNGNEISALAVPENGSKDYQVSLKATPTQPVVVNLVVSGDWDIAASSSNLSWTVAQAGESRTVTVSAPDDTDFVRGSATITHQASGGNYAGLNVDLPVTEVEDDVGIAILPGALTIPEGGSATYTVGLGAGPEYGKDVVVNLAGVGDDDITFTPASLTFTAGANGNWQTAQTVTVRAAADNDADNGTKTITHTAATTDTHYSGVTASLVVTEREPVITLTPSTSLSVAEGGSETYTVALNNRPSGTVTVAIGYQSGGDDDITVNKTNLYFYNNSSWSQPQTVTVSAREDDDSLAGTRTITHTASGGGYANVTASILATEVDNDAAIIVTPRTGAEFTVPENSTETYTVKLATQPSADVTVTIAEATAGENTDASITVTSSKSLTFTSSNWFTAQTVTLSAADDTDFAHGKRDIAHTASGGGYGNLSKTITVREIENDKGIHVEPASLTVRETGSATYAVNLGSDFLSSEHVTVTLTAAGGDSDVTFDTDPNTSGNQSQLTFTNNNRHVPQTVTVSAASDNDALNGTKTITHTAAGGNYANVTATLTVTEGEPPLLVRNAGDTADITALTVNEGSSSSTGFASYKVKLSSQPSGSVTVHLYLQSTSGDNPGDSNISVSPRSLTFNTQNWNLPKNVKVWASNDSDQTNGSRTITHRVNGGGYTNAGSVVLTATEVDDDVPTLTTGGVTATGVTLTIANHTAAWWYKSATAGATTCESVAQNTNTATVTGLTPATSYTYTAYSNSACSTSLAAAAAFTTDGFSVSNLGEADHTGECSMGGGDKCAVGFTTGSASNGYVLHSVTAKIKKTGTPTGFAATLHSDNNGNPTGNALATLSGSAPTSTAGAEYTYTCAGSGCALTNGATYYVQFTQTGSGTPNAFILMPTESDDETKVPSGNGWSLANQTNNGGSSTWYEKYDFAGKVKIVATAGSGGNPNQQQPAQEPEPSSQPPAQFTPTLTAGDGKLTASWTPPADNGDAITGYRVQYRQHPGGVWAVSGGVLNADARSLEIAGLENGATYRVRAQAQNGAGWGQYSWPLAEITVPAVQTPPGSVGSVSASRSNGNVAVSWNAADGATKYHVTYTDNGGQSWSLAALEHSATSITISGADDDKAYVVGVRAGNDAGWSGWVNSNTVPAVQTPPGSVGSVSATHNGDAVSVSWAAASGATKYHVTYTDNGGASWSLTALEHSTTSITISGADSGKSYVVGVRAGNDAGWSGWTNSPPAKHSE